MSVNYAAELSYYPNKGVCGLPELSETAESVESKVRELAQKLQSSRHCVVHTGAGISTSAGIPDFRGPRGVWTLEAKGEAPKVDVTFEQAQPTFTHRAILALHQAGIVKCVVTQNIDGLHMRSGLPSTSLAELHGSMFVEVCDTCRKEYVRDTVVPTIGQKYTGGKCTATKTTTGRMCRGRLKDSVLDWEHDLPSKHIELADEHCRQADFSLALGTSLRIEPANQLPLHALKNGGQFCIVNLQETKMDKRATMLIRARVDEVMRRVCEILKVTVDGEQEKVENEEVAGDVKKTDAVGSPDTKPINGFSNNQIEESKPICEGNGLKRQATDSADVEHNEETKFSKIE